MIFNASIYLNNVKKEVNLTFPYGLFCAIDDFFLRIHCNEEFFSEYSMKHLWRSNIFLWKGSKGGFFQPIGANLPHTRFYDYRQAYDSTKMNMFEDDEPFIGSNSSGFFKKIPFSDNDRMMSSKQMIYIALLWVYLHEKGHYWEGHLHFMSKQSKTMKLKNNEIEGGFVVENSLLNNIFEAQADAYATRNVLKLISKNYKSNIFIPTYCKDFNSNNSWYLRTLITSIGIVILIFEKAKWLYESARYFSLREPDDYTLPLIIYDTHPTPQTRFITIIDEIIKWAELDSFEIISKKMLKEAIYGSFRDIYWASKLITDKNDLVDRGIGIHPPFLLPEFSFIEKSDNIINIIEATISGNLNKINDSEYKKWFWEFITIKQNLGSNVYNDLSEFRKMTSSSDATIYGIE